MSIQQTVQFFEYHFKSGNVGKSYWYKPRKISPQRE